MFAILGFIILFTSLFNSQSHLLNLERNSTIISKFKNWIETHKVEASDDEHLVRIFGNWLSNDKYIDEINNLNLPYRLGHNEYSGMSSDEFSKFMNFESNSQLLYKNKVFLRGTNFKSGKMDNSVYLNLCDDGCDDNMLEIPTSIDWRTKGVVSPIRNQGQCGSCWAFSGTSTLESAYAIKYSKLYDLSEQQSVSCAGLKYGNLGCNGGYYSGLWDFAKTNGGICTESSYSYTSGTTGQTGNCQTSCSPVSGTKVTSYVDVTPYSDSALMTGLTIEPVSVAIQADAKTFQLYSGGIYTDLAGCGNNLNHAVVLVGYGTESGQDYYILRNSWGNWGESGYMRIGRGSQYGKYGMCGLLSDPMYPIV